MNIDFIVYYYHLLNVCTISSSFQSICKETLRSQLNKNSKIFVNEPCIYSLQLDCLQSAFSLKIRVVLDLSQRDCKPRCYITCSNFSKKNKRLLAVYFATFRFIIHQLIHRRYIGLKFSAITNIAMVFQ